MTACAFRWFGLGHVRPIVRYRDEHGWWRLSGRRRQEGA